MKFLKLRSLGVRLLLLCAVCVSAALLPAFLYFTGLLREIKLFKLELSGADMLSSLSYLTHSAYHSSNGESVDEAGLKKTFASLSGIASKLDYNADLKNNPRMQAAFSSAVLEAFVKTPDSGEIVADMAEYITIHSGLFTDQNVGVHLFMGVSSDVFPKLYSGILRFSAALKKCAPTPDKSQINELSSSHVLLSEYAKEAVSELRKACSLCPPEKSVLIVADIAKLNSALGELNAAISRVWHGRGIDILQVRATLSTLENSAFDLWLLSGKSLSESILLRIGTAEDALKMALIQVSAALFVIFILALFVARSITNAARKTKTLVSLAVDSGVSDARDFNENSPQRIGVFSDIDAGVLKLLDNYAGMVGSAKSILDSSSQLNDDAQEILSTQKPRLNGVSNSLLRVDAKINLRDKSDAALAASAQSLRDRLNIVEQLARSQSKSVLDVSSHIKDTLSTAAKIISNFDALRDMASKMSVIAETFTGVADQANILSLNLSIETAKAGIKGSGLGTLAEQIKILSKRTVVSVIDIESIRDSILETLEAGATDTDKFLASLESDSKILDEVDSALSDLTSSLSKISVSTNAISVSLRERATSDMSMREAQENLAKVGEALSEFAAFSKNASLVVNKTRDALSQAKI